ncbi:MAG: alpha/beta fold hydrolase [Chloroflexi bacterium]|nr:alpha/beta fold hydrolase [Chloroflexota bacterium]
MTTPTVDSLRAQSPTADHIPQTVAEHRARLKKAQVEGGHIAYVDEGPRDGEPVVLLHGMPTNSWLWRKVIPHLTVANLRVIAPDLLGWGASDKPADLSEYTLDKQSRRVTALLDKIGVDKATLVVHDLGGPWAWEIVDRAPGRVARLVILNTSAYTDGFQPPAMIKMMMSPLGPMMLSMMSGKLMGPMMMASFIKEFTGHPEVINSAAAEGYWLPMNEGATRPFQQFVSNFDFVFAQMPRWQAALKRLNVPATILWGKKDPVLNHAKIPVQFARDLRVPPERVHILADANHFLAEDKAQEVAERVIRFVQET